MSRYPKSFEEDDYDEYTADDLEQEDKILRRLQKEFKKEFKETIRKRKQKKKKHGNKI